MRVLKYNIPVACILVFVFLFLPEAYAQECNNQSIFPGDIIEFGNYEQDNNLENGFEPVEWIALDVLEGKVLLISKYGLDMKQYNETLYDVPWGRVMWESSSIRFWLNGEFYNECFSEFEREKIMKTEVVNGFTKYSHIDGGSNTEDNIFLLSIDEAERYFDTDKERICYVTKENSNHISLSFIY